MVGKFIEIENGGHVVVKPVCWTIKPLRDIIEFYPEDYDKILHYFHCMISLNPNDNPFADIDQELKEEKIQRWLNIDVDSDNDIIKEGLEVFSEGYETTIYRSYEALKHLLDGINEDIRTMRLSYDKESGNSGNVIGVVKNLAVIKKELKEAKKDYLEEQGEVRGRGGVEMSYDEDQDDDLDLDEDND